MLIEQRLQERRPLSIVDEYGKALKPATLAGPAEPARSIADDFTIASRAGCSRPARL